MALEATNISVSFPGVKALRKVSLVFQPGRIHAVLGANGSGKSTLVKVLTGIYHPDKDCGGKIIIDGHEYQSIESPSVAHEKGIRVVHQESPLVHTFTVAESVALSKEYPMKGPRVDWKAVRKYVQDLFGVFEIDMDPDTLTEHLTAAERNMVAMATAIGMNRELEETKALILDEADASIPEAEAEYFLKHVRRIADMGIPVIMVTHRLKAARNYCDDVSILNGGELVYSGLIKDTSEDLIVSNMIRKPAEEEQQLSVDRPGAALDELWRLLGSRMRPKKDTPVLQIKRVVAENLNHLSLELKTGEVLGIVGIPDSGVNELPLLLGGELALDSGEVVVDGKQLSRKSSPRRAIRAGLAILPNDRAVRGGIMPCSLRENMLLPNESRFWHKKKLAKATVDLCSDIFDVNPRGQKDMDFGKFSGGNQQKAIMAKWLLPRPAVFILNDPTYGVDPASRLKIFDLIKSAAHSNIGIIIFSTEPEQLVNVCTRVLALQNGKVGGELTVQDGTLTREAIAKWCYT